MEYYLSEIVQEVAAKLNQEKEISKAISKYIIQKSTELFDKINNTHINLNTKSNEIKNSISINFNKLNNIFENIYNTIEYEFKFENIKYVIFKEYFKSEDYNINTKSIEKLLKNYNIFNINKSENIIISKTYNFIDNEINFKIENYAEKIIEKLDRLGLKVSERLVYFEFRSPKDLQELVGAPGGSIYGTSSNGARAAFFRAKNRSDIKGLYLVGGSAHPGGGLPLVGMSAEIVAEAIG